MSYAIQREQSDMYLEAFKDILRRNSMNFLTLEVSDDYKDTQEATDMLIKIEGGDVALRVRNPSCKFRDFTVRTRSKYGGKTEVDKLKEGFGDWYLYGWGDGLGKVNEYILVDLHKVRQFKLLDKHRRIISNNDGTGFISIPIGELQMCGCIVSKSISEKTQRQVDNYIQGYIEKISNY